ncbi:P-loop ATPase, Sll1717 family [Rhizobium sp. RAF56]|uniref:P-loop ATPase, Sll1717 family n=1 Tax=Rhizobium sp. RAF56 TaxID=3233062 RepID=UPI003F9BD608
MNSQLSALEVLRQSSFGQRTAEEEVEQLSQYFVETEHWRRVFEGAVDIVYGPKGSGKSAIYSLVVKNESVLFDRNILAIPGENPQGAVAFQSLRDDPPRDEFEFVSLWKLYILTLCGKSFKDYDLQNDKCRAVVDTLQEANLLPRSFTLAKALKYALDYVKALARRIESVEGG